MEKVRIRVLTDSSPALTTMLEKLACHNIINPNWVDRIRHHKLAHIIWSVVGLELGDV